MNVRRLILIPFLFIFIIFSSCKADEDIKEELISSLSSITSAEYTAKITASFPTREAVFTINYSHTPDGDRASVLSPAEVAGVSYSVSDGGGCLEFDGAILEIGKLSDGGISPFSCIGSLLTTWKSGSFDEISRSAMYGKNAFFTISRRTQDLTELEYRTWFSEDEFLPLYAEIFSDGDRIIQCEFERGIHNRK